MLHECLEHAARLRGIAGLVIEVGRLQRRLALHLRRLAGRLRDLLELERRLTGLVRFGIRHREFAGDVRLQRALRKVMPEAFEHHDGPIPLLLADQQRRSIEIRIRAHLRGGRHFRHAQEILHRAAAVAGLVLLFPLLVDRGREPLDDDAPLGIVRRHQRLRRTVARLGLVEIPLFEIGVRDHGPRDALLGGIDRGLPCQQRFAPRPSPAYSPWRRTARWPRASAPARSPGAAGNVCANFSELSTLRL